MDLEARVAELERRLARISQAGVIEAADYETARVRVRCGERLSPWLPWATRRAGPDVDWWAPEVGEQVEIHAPNGEMNGARVTPAYYSDQVPPPANTPDVRLIRFGNGTEIMHDRAANLLRLTTPDDIDIQAGGSAMIQIDGDVDATVGGKLTATVTGDISVSGAANVSVAAAGNLDLTAAGNATVAAGGALTLSGNPVSIN